MIHQWTEEAAKLTPGWSLFPIIESQVNSHLVAFLLQVLLNILKDISTYLQNKNKTKWNLVITAYAKLVPPSNHKELYAMEQMNISAIILDEAHYIRNYAGSTFKQLYALRRKYGFLLSGKNKALYPETYLL
jgi:SNF2 family DNA or RNA helicase